MVPSFMYAIKINKGSFYLKDFDWVFEGAASSTLI